MLQYEDFSSEFSQVHSSYLQLYIDKIEALIDAAIFWNRKSILPKFFHDFCTDRRSKEGHLNLITSHNTYWLTK